MAEFRQWLEDDQLGSARFPHIKLLPPVDIWTKWVQPSVLYKGDHLNTYHCNNCSLTWQVPKGLGKPASCPRCSSYDIVLVDQLKEPS